MRLLSETIRTQIVMRLLFACVFALLLVFGPGSLRAEQQRLVFASTPWKDPATLREIHAPLMVYLARVLDVETVFHVAADYEELSDRLNAKTVDVGFFSSNAYVQARKALPELQYLASIRKRNVFGEIQDHYRGYIVTRTTSPIRKIEDLKGATFGYTDPQSGSGYLYPRLLLRKNGFDPDNDFSRTFMLKKHDKVIKAVLQGSVDAGAVYDDAFRDADRKNPGMLRIVAKTPEIPFDAYAAGGHVSQEMVQALRKALVEYENAPERRADLLGSPHSFAVRDDSFYDIVREANESKP